MKTKNLFTPIPPNLTNEVIDLLVKKDNTKIERIVSKGHASPATGWYDQTSDEWVLLLQGAAIIIFENGTELKLKAGDYVEIAAHTRHRVKWTEPDTETVWLAIHY